MNKSNIICPPNIAEWLCRACLISKPIERLEHESTPRDISGGRSKDSSKLASRRIVKYEVMRSISSGLVLPLSELRFRKQISSLGVSFNSSCSNNLTEHQKNPKKNSKNFQAFLLRFSPEERCNRIYIIFSPVVPKNVGIHQEGKIACRSENHIKSKYLTLSEQQRRETNIYMTAECKLDVQLWVRKNNKESVRGGKSSVNKQHKS